MFTDEIIKKALQEDLGQGDITTEAIIPDGLIGRGVIVAKQELVIAGLGIAGGVFLILDPHIKLKQHVSDGDQVTSKATVLEIEGKYRTLLTGERLALNFLQRLSGIATLTKKFVEKTQGTKAKILDTRKTTPLYRHLEKYAVRMGGGMNHRWGLYDEILIKDNHITACHGSVEEAVKRAKQKYPEKKVVAEITDLAEIEAAISQGAARLLLDNMDNEKIAKALQIIKDRAETEISGGITLDRVEKLAKLGVDFISVGSLTHSAPAADLSFEILPT